MPSIKYYALSDVEGPVHISTYEDLLSIVQGENSFEAKVFLQHQWDCDTFVLLPNNFTSVEHIGRYGWDCLFLDMKSMGYWTIKVWMNHADDLGFKVALEDFE